MIPDKIYVPILKECGVRPLIGTRWWDRSYTQDDEVLNCIPYIRKDALVEWLQQGFDWAKNPVISVQQIIDKLNSL